MSATLNSMAWLPPETVRQIFDYNATTGRLIWKVKVAKRVVVGAPAGYISREGHYLVVGLFGKLIYAHRLVWAHVHGVWPVDFIDHIDRDKQNNRASNLREATDAENKQNKGPRRDSRSGVPGVRFHAKTGMWHATIAAHHKRLFVGSFKEFEAAKAARLDAVAAHHPFASQGVAQ